jgi:hypothetical protein
VLRHFSSSDRVTVNRPLLPIAERWFPKPQELETSAGAHRFVWDLAAGESGSGLGDDDEDADAAPPGPRVPPGAYTLRLIVDGVQMDRPLQVTMDPRVDATPQDLDRQFSLADSIYAQTLSSREAMAELESVDSQLMKLDSTAKSNPPDLARAIRSALAELRQIRGGDNEDAQEGANKIGLAKANAGLSTVLQVVESGHRAAPAQALQILSEMNAAARQDIQSWQQFKTTELTKLNAALVRANRPPLQIAAIEEEVHYAMTR